MYELVMKKINKEEGTLIDRNPCVVKYRHRYLKRRSEMFNEIIIEVRLTETGLKEYKIMESGVLSPVTAEMRDFKKKLDILIAEFNKTPLLKARRE